MGLFNSTVIISPNCGNSSIYSSNVPIFVAFSVIVKILSQFEYDYEIKLEIPPKELGDFAFPCFSLVPILKKSPNKIAKDITKKIEKIKWIKKIESKHAYVNFFIDERHIKISTIKSILKNQKNYGRLRLKTVMPGMIEVMEGIKRLI